MTYLREVLNEVGAIIDPANDVVMLYLAVLAVTFITLLLLKRSPDKKGTLYFSVPCWLLVTTMRPSSA